ncbi:unnamed protein product [Medioppia subpectinata]|uniref:Uncharacterized protein n=1 Tax=Medioppia subpectinata TaxID=1979941 RepID=A0A7R9L1J7_9ACAR|nr:unnamed protein product [Medioppia subpectinata]CAG2113645.1 unnamed protein product [Medioppia subpectinata]
MSYIIKLALLTALVCTMVRANSLPRFLLTAGTDAKDANTCIALLLNRPCHKIVKMSQTEPYYCCMLWNFLECFQTNYRSTCKPDDAAALEKIWYQVHLDMITNDYTQANCTAHNYGQYMSRDVCKG